MHTLVNLGIAQCVDAPIENRVGFVIMKPVVLSTTTAFRVTKRRHSELGAASELGG